jgi:hypothetical protein
MQDFINTLSEEQKEALLSALQGGNKQNAKDSVDTQDEESNNVITEDFRVIKNPSTKENSRRQPVRARHNTWTDNGEDRHIVTPEAPLTPRTRSAPKQKTVKCHVCGKSQTINASLVYGEYYRCDRCVG